MQRIRVPQNRHGHSVELRLIKVLHVIGSLDTGGTESTLANLALAMDKKRVENIVVTLAGYDTPLSLRIAASGVQVIKLGMLRPKWKFAFGVFKLVSIIRRLKPDVIQGWLHESELVATVSARICGIPVFWNVRGSQMNWSDFKWHLPWVIKILARLSSIPEVVISNSSAGRLAHEEMGYHPRRWELIHNGFDADSFTPHPTTRADLKKLIGAVEGEVIVGHVARFHKVKDHAGMLRAVGIVSRRVDNARFVFVGKGVDMQNPAIAEAVRAEGIANRVHFLGEISDIPRITAGFDIAVNSSYTEGFPNAVGEAMSCAVPCVATDVGECREIIGDAGIVVPAKDPEAMANALESLILARDEERRRIGAIGRSRVEKYYSLEKSAEKYVSLYEEVALKHVSAR
ncbi:MAG: glycosyltransferase [Nitrospinae bacterium]|nr:glycosyltransferase [Nitrospinota bacterium]